jgi:hypothetical protein
MPRRRAAVVIGVNKTGGGLLPLESCAAAAGAVADWLKSGGFEVTTITDAAGKVKWEEIATAVKDFVEAGNCQQLVVYFSGHGLWKNGTELWLLSDAPGDANAAVSWTETADLARDCGIPNVVLISDACRSIPVTPQQLRVRGALVFPNEERTRARIDKFIAAAMGRPAYEIALGAGGQKASAFTHCFLRAFQAPDRDMIREVTEDGRRIDVVPNRRLGKYLQREVGALLASINIQYEQTPDAEVLSDDDVYIGRVRLAEDAPLKTFGPGPAPAAPVIRLHDVAAMAISDAMNVPSRFAARDHDAIADLARTSGFNDAIDQARTTAIEVTHFETETGFAVIGAETAEVAAANAEATIVAAGDSNPGVVRVALQAPAASVALHFDNGRGTVLAAIAGYIGHILVDGNSIINVSYVPSENGRRWQDYLPHRERIERLRATAAAAARHGVFRLDDRRMAAEVAAVLRLPSFDPALCLHAAYAYADADLRDDLKAIHTSMEQGISARLFDVAMLARTLTPGPVLQPGANTLPVVPFCPMLTKGWNLLRARRIEIPGGLNDAQDELEPALWTTFKPARMQMIIDAVKRGELT